MRLSQSSSSRLPQTSAAAAQLGEQTVWVPPPGTGTVGKVHCHAPPTQESVTSDVHSGAVATGDVPQVSDFGGGMTFSSNSPLQSSSRPLQVSCADVNEHGYSQRWSPSRSWKPGRQPANTQVAA